MYLAYGARALAAVALGVSGGGRCGTGGDRGTGGGQRDHHPRSAAPGSGSPRRGPSSTTECEQSIHIACYNPAQIQRAYNLPALYSRGITGKGATIVIIDPYGSPTIASDLRNFDSTEGVPNPPSLQVSSSPQGKVPAFDPNDANMVGWASETTLDVEWAHTIAPGARILLVETPGGGKTGTVGVDQIVRAEKYVIRHHLGGVISQSFVATEQAIGCRRDHVAARCVPGCFRWSRRGAGRLGRQRRDRFRVGPGALLHPSSDILARQ